VILCFCGVTVGGQEYAHSPPGPQVMLTMEVGVLGDFPSELANSCPHLGPPLAPQSSQSICMCAPEFPLKKGKELRIGAHILKTLSCMPKLNQEDSQLLWGCGANGGAESRFNPRAYWSG